MQSSKILEDSREFHTKYCKKKAKTSTTLSSNIHIQPISFTYSTSPTNSTTTKTHILPPHNQSRNFKKKNIKLKSKVCEREILLIGNGLNCCLLLALLHPCCCSKNFLSTLRAAVEARPAALPGPQAGGRLRRRRRRCVPEIGPHCLDWCCCCWLQSLTC